MTGPFNPNPNHKVMFCVHLVLYQGHGSFHPVSSLVCPQVSVWVKKGMYIMWKALLTDVLTSKSEEPQKQCG